MADAAVKGRSGKWEGASFVGKRRMLDAIVGQWQKKTVVICTTIREAQKFQEWVVQNQADWWMHFAFTKYKMHACRLYYTIKGTNKTNKL